MKKKVLCIFALAAFLAASITGCDGSPSSGGKSSTPPGKSAPDKAGGKTDID